MLTHRDEAIIKSPGWIRDPSADEKIGDPIYFIYSNRMRVLWTLIKFALSELRYSIKFR